MANNTTDILNEVEEIEPLEYDVERPVIIRQEEFIKELGYQFRFNRVRDIFEYKHKHKPWEDMKERVVKSIRREFKLSTDFRGKGECPSVNALYEIIDTDIMAQNFNPFDDFFKNNKWDGRDHLTQLINTVTIADITIDNFELREVFTLLFTRWMLASVACTTGDAANHVMLLLLSEQHGTFKTTWLNNLCPPSLSDYIHCGHIRPELTDNITANIVAEKIICNIDDQLDGILHKDFGAIKSLITAPFVSNRKSYRRDENKRIRRVNFCGSVNNTDIFRDSQNRRYLTFEKKKIDWIAAKAVDIDQVWLQVYKMYKVDKLRHYFDKTDEHTINQINNHYSAISAEQDYFSKLFEQVDKSNWEAKFYTPSEILSVIKKASGLNIFPQNLSVALKRLGIVKDKQRQPWKGATQSRDGYWLRENFKKEGDRITIFEEPTLPAPKDDTF